MAVGGLGEDLVDDIVPLMALLNHLIDGAPVGEATQITIVDEYLDLELAREMGIVIGGLLGIVTIDGIELEAALATPLDSLVEKLALANRPQNEPVTILTEHLQGIDGKGDLLANSRILMGNDSTVKIDCN